MFKRIVALVLLFIGAMLLTGCSTPSNEPVDLNGDWSYSSDSVSFKAVVTDEEINVDLIMDDSEGLYWSGSFVDEAVNGDTIFSDADVEALDESFLGSGDTEKNFDFKDGKLVFSFTIVGVTQDIELSR